MIEIDSKQASKQQTQVIADLVVATREGGLNADLGAAEGGRV